MKQHKIAVFGDLSLSNCLDWAVTLTVCAWLFFIGYQLGGVRPDTMVISAGFLGVALAFHTLGLMVDSPQNPIKFNPLGFAFFPALLYMIANLYLLSDFVWRGREELLAMVQGVTIFWLAVQNFRTKNHVWMVLGSVILLAILGTAIGIMQFFYNPEWLPKVIDPIEGRSFRVPMAGEYIGRATGSFAAPATYAGFMLLVGFPMLVAGFSRRFTGMARAFFIYAGFLMIGAVFLSMSRGALMLVVVGIFLLPFAVRAKRSTTVIAWLLLLMLFAGSFSLLFLFNEDFQLRLLATLDASRESVRPVMWQAAWGQFLDAPILGNGLGGYDVLFENHRPEGFNREAIHASNDYLETLADLGAVGFILFWGPVGAIAFLAVKEWFAQPESVRLGASDNPRAKRRMTTPKFIISALGLGLFLFGGHLLMEPHLKTPALLLLFFLFLGFIGKCVPIERIKLPRAPLWRVCAMALGLMLSVLIPLWAIPNSTGYLYVQNGDRKLDRLTENLAELKQDEVYYSELIEMLQLGLAQMPDHAEAWSDLSSTVAMQDFLYPGRSAEFGEQAETHARQALEINDQLPNAWINLGHALSLQGRMGDAGKAYQRATEIAPNRSDVWYFYALHLNSMNATRDEARVAVERALALQPSNEKAADLRRKILVP